MTLERFDVFSQEIQMQVPGFETGLQIVRDLVVSLQGKGLLPQEVDFSKAQAEAAPKRDLRQETLNLLSSNTFREPNAEEKRILSSLGYDIFLSTEAKTLYAVVDENKGYFWSDELNYVNARPNLRDYTPPALTVALRSKELFLDGSFNQSQPTQLEMLEGESQAVQGLVSDARAIMLPASTDAQLDLAYFKETGKILFRNRFARALDETSGVGVALVGRSRSASRLDIDGRVRSDGFSFIGALSAVVFLENR